MVFVFKIHTSYVFCTISEGKFNLVSEKNVPRKLRDTGANPLYGNNLHPHLRALSYLKLLR